MRKTHEPQAALKALIAALGVSTMVMASAPAHAGPFDALKKAVKKEAMKELDKASPKLAESALRAVAGGKKEDAGSPPEGKGRIVDTRDVTGDGIPDIVLLMPDGTLKVIVGEGPAPQAAALQQAGHTTVATADEVLAPRDPEAAGRPVEGDADYTTHPEESIDKSGRAKVSVANGKKPTSEPQEMSQNQHTTVETADEVLAPQRPQRAKLSQNGHTTVETADEVQAPERPQRAVYPKINDYEGGYAATPREGEARSTTRMGGGSGAGKVSVGGIQ